MISVSRLGDFGKFFAANFLSKVAQIFSDFLGYFAKYHLEVKTGVRWYFLGNTGRVTPFEMIRLLRAFIYIT